MDFALHNYLLFWVIILGLCFGSFYNVVILRSLSGESIVFPNSKCPKCQNSLKFWHNIPVISYILLGGKCAFCKEKISIQYPLIELITSGLFVFCFIKYGLSWQTLFGFVLCSSLLIMAMTDLKEKVVECNIAIGLAVTGVIYNWLANDNIVSSLLGIFLGIIIMEIFARIGYLFTKNRAFGEADTYVAAALGACFGLSGLCNILLYTLIASAIFIIPIFLYKQFQNNNKFICILFILFTLSALIYKSLFQNWYLYSIVAILGIVLSVQVLKNLKQEQTPMYLPLVPAFAAAALYFFFF